MGQYFLLVNEDKREYVHPHRIGGLAKLFEWCANPQAGAIPYLLRRSDDTGGGDIGDPDSVSYAGRWAGDRVSLIGDYDQSELYDRAQDEFTDISQGLLSEYNQFIQIDELKLTDQARRFINPDMVIDKNGAVSDPKIDTGKGVIDYPKNETGGD